MTARRWLRILLLTALALFGPGCVAVLPNHVLLIYEHDASGETGTTKPQRTATDKLGITGVYDLH